MFGSFSITGSLQGSAFNPDRKILRKRRGFNAPMVFAPALLWLAGCTLDEEQTVRDRLDTWLSLKETVYFESKSDCTAGLFRTAYPDIKSAAARVTSVGEGLTVLSTGQPVAFAVPDLSPAEVSEGITSVNLPEGVGVITSGLGGRKCMDETMIRRFAAALTAPDAIMIFDTTENALAILRPAQRLVFFTRGAV